ncbi:hypothetical protein [uncultured Gemmiger sp.]|uniref:hypothetical protein n=1 Tax=uncultured Gemmiger sp. TaxID=1623490 RepID=UPI0025F29281|nr:hypothetical protein [uncultured Gemmiger sp.]
MGQAAGSQLAALLGLRIPATFPILFLCLHPAAAGRVPLHQFQTTVAALHLISGIPGILPRQVLGHHLLLGIVDLVQRSIPVPVKVLCQQSPVQRVLLVGRVFSSLADLPGKACPELCSCLQQLIGLPGTTLHDLRRKVLRHFLRIFGVEGLLGFYPLFRCKEIPDLFPVLQGGTGFIFQRPSSRRVGRSELGDKTLFRFAEIYRDAAHDLPVSKGNPRHVFL